MTSSNQNLNIMVSLDNIGPPPKLERSTNYNHEDIHNSSTQCDLEIRHLLLITPFNEPLPLSNYSIRKGEQISENNK